MNQISPDDAPPDFSNPLVMIAMPNRGDTTIETAISLARMANYTKFRLMFCPITGFNVSENRTRCVAYAWRDKCTHILWIDSDMGFPPWALESLMDWKVPVVGANYPKKTVPPVPTAYIETDDYSGPLYTEIGQKGIERADFIGFGLALTHIGVFDKLHDEWTAEERSSGVPPFFHLQPDKTGRKWCTEDVYFAKRCKNSKIPIYVDHELSNAVIHVGPHHYDNRAAIYGRNINKERAEMKTAGFSEEDLKPEDNLLVDIPV